MTYWLRYFRSGADYLSRLETLAHMWGDDTSPLGVQVSLSHLVTGGSHEWR